MIIGREAITIDGKNYTLRSPEVFEAEKLLEYLKLVTAESDFLLMYPEEAEFPAEFEEKFINDANESKRGFLMGVYDGEEIIGLLGIADNTRLKIKHRAEMNISIKKKYWNKGIGTAVIKKAMDVCRENGIMLLTLGTFSSNGRARHTYEKLGFKATGKIEMAFRQKDGSFADDIIMSAVLSQMVN